MKQFYDIYNGKEKLSPLVREISCSNNLLIMAGTKTVEAREFYFNLCIKNKYLAHELDHQIYSMICERTMLSNKKNEVFISKNTGLSCLRDNDVLKFLDLPNDHKEKDLRKSIVSNIKILY